MAELSSSRGDVLTHGMHAHPDVQAIIFRSRHPMESLRLRYLLKPVRPLRRTFGIRFTWPKARAYPPPLPSDLPIVLKGDQDVHRAFFTANVQLRNSELELCDAGDWYFQACGHDLFAPIVIGDVVVQGQVEVVVDPEVAHSFLV